MAGNRIYVPFMMFSSRIVNMQHLWTPSTEYLGKKQEKPSYFVTCIVPKTRQNWWEEPALAANMAAYNELLAKSGMTPQHVAEWPIKDGDMPPEPGKAPSEWAKGQWIFGGSSSSPIKVEIVQNGTVQPLPAKVNVKPGDFVALGMSTAVKQNNPRALKHYCNTVLFTGPGEEIAVGNSVSGSELMAHAQQQGLNVVGFQGAPGGFAPPMGAPGFTPQGPASFPGNNPGAGFVPTPGGPAQAPYASPPNFGGAAPGPGNGSAFPSNPVPMGAPGFPGNAPQQPNFAPSTAPMGAPYGAPNQPQFPAGPQFGPR